MLESSTENGVTTVFTSLVRAKNELPMVMNVIIDITSKSFDSERKQKGTKVIFFIKKKKKKKNGRISTSCI